MKHKLTNLTPHMLIKSQPAYWSRSHTQNVNDLLLQSNPEIFMKLTVPTNCSFSPECNKIFQFADGAEAGAGDGPAE